MYNTNESEFIVPLAVGASVSPNNIGGNTTDSGDSSLAAATDILLLYVPPVLLGLGLLGNCFCIIVLNSKRMRQSRCCFPLTALACVDISVLLIGLLRLWLKRLVGFDVRVMCVASCKIHTYLSYVSRHLSSWTLMVLAVERMVSVYNPLKAKHWCSKRRTSLSWVSVVATICLVNTPLLFLKDLGPVTYFVEGENITVITCDYTLGKAVHYAVWSADAVLLCCIPFIVICASNVMILSKTVCCMDKHLHRTLSNSKRTRLGLSQMTFMLLLVCFVFLFCTTPIMVFFLIGARFWEAQEQSVVNFAYGLCNLIYYSNSVCNFALYCLGGSQFRQTAKQVFCGRCLRGRDEVRAVNGIDLDGETSISMSRRKSSTLINMFSHRTKSIHSERSAGIREALRGSI